VAPVLFLAGVSLLALPAMARRLGRRLAPDEWSRLCVVALVVGAAVLELSLILYAAPTVLRAAGVPELADVCERALGRLLPGRAALGWPAALAALAFPVVAGLGALRAHRSQSAVRVETCLGEHGEFCGHAFVVLPTDSVLAFCSNGPIPQIVVSRGLVAALSPKELDAVLRHEAAHLEYRHQRFLLVASALDHGLAVLPFIRTSTAALRTALERWADEAAAGTSCASRAVLRRALLGVTAAMMNPGVAAFSAAETVVERLNALGDDPPRPSALRRIAVYAPGVAISGTVVASLGAWAGQAGHVVAWVSHCPT
jgi:Zn-dependent protease with chaperone function